MIGRVAGNKSLSQSIRQDIIERTDGIPLFVEEMTKAVLEAQREGDQISELPSTPALRREQIKLQVALISPVIHVKGFAAPETKAAVERARLLIEQVEAMEEPPEDPLLLFTVLFGFWIASLAAFNGDVVREFSVQFLTLAEKRGTTVPLMIGHRLMGAALLFTGDIAQGRLHLDRAIRFYDPVLTLGWQFILTSFAEITRQRRRVPMNLSPSQMKKARRCGKR
jgi:hypothetical protein